MATKKTAKNTKKRTAQNQENEKKFDIYQFVTDQIIERMEQGHIPWIRPWDSVGLPTDGFCLFNCRKYATGKRYSLLNQFLLGEDGIYLSFKEITECGGHLKKGSKSRVVVFWKPLVVDRKDDDGNILYDNDGNPLKKMIFMLRYNRVFHIKDTEGVFVKKWMKEVEKIEKKITDHSNDSTGTLGEVLADYIDREGIRLTEKISPQAYYAPDADEIVVPARGQFEKIEGFLATLAHESTHSTGNKKRLDRFNEKTQFDRRGSDYSKEELVAEIGSAVLLHWAGIDTEMTIKNSAAYIQGWSKALKNDKKMIISAASKADKAVKLILGDKADEYEFTPDDIEEEVDVNETEVA